jgi:hypothetical protein
MGVGRHFTLKSDLGLRFSWFGRTGQTRKF